MYFPFCRWRLVLMQWILSGESETAKTTPSIITKFWSATKIRPNNAHHRLGLGENLLSMIVALQLAFIPVSFCHRLMMIRLIYSRQCEYNFARIICANVHANRPNSRECETGIKITPKKGRGFAHVTHFCMHNCGVRKNSPCHSVNCDKQCRGRWTTAYRT